MKTLLVTNIKGGVGKSSSAVAIATGIKLVQPKAKILLIDGDPQASIKTYFGLRIGPDYDFSTFLIEDTPLQGAVQKLSIRDCGDIDVVLSSRRLSDADIKMAAFPRREETLRMRFKHQADDYDYCVIDSAPAMNLVLLNFMTFCDYWIVPATMDAFSASNIDYLFMQKKLVEEFYEHSINILGILPTVYDKRTIVAQDGLAFVTKKFAKHTTIFEPIPVDSIVKRAQVKKQCIYDFLGRSKAAEAYHKLSGELVGMMHA